MNIATEKTKKYEPYPEYKKSGVDWLGEVPEQWKIIQLKRLFKVVNGSTPKSSKPEYWDGDIPWATPDDLGTLNSMEIAETARTITESGYQSCGTTLVSANSIILSTRAPIGHLALTTVQMCTNQGCRFLVPRSNINSRFYYYQLLAGRQELKSYGQGSTFMELSKTKLGILMLAFPHKSEQRTITDFLDCRTGPD